MNTQHTPGPCAAVEDAPTPGAPMSRDAAAEATHYRLPPLPEPHWPRYYRGDVPAGAFTKDQMHAYARAALSAASSAEPALHRFDEAAAEGMVPTARLRYFCSLAMSGQDWMDVEPFFDAVESPRAAEPVSPTSAGDVELRAAAQAVIDRWDTPLWKDAPATAHFIGRLRAALAHPAAPAQPVGLINAVQIATIRECAMKPEEIDDPAKRTARTKELLRWFDRLAMGNANPKWLREHAFELAYIIATVPQPTPAPAEAADGAPTADDLALVARGMERLKRGEKAIAEGKCWKAPEGWHCTRAPFHEGPCAAVQDAAPQAPAPTASQIAKVIHWPECWDTAAYPTALHAFIEVYEHFRCSECAPAPKHTKPPGNVTS